VSFQSYQEPTVGAFTGSTPPGMPRRRPFRDPHRP
jgi:hypothetical protein